MVNNCSFYSKMTLLESALDSECRQKWQQDVTKQVVCCLQIYAQDGTLLTAKYLASGTDHASNAQSLPGGMHTTGIDSHISLVLVTC